MPKDLILNSLEIQRFRCFRELRIGHLGRVNLIVGKNNVGKSTVLEALRLFAKPASPADLLEILASRNETSRAEIEDWNHDPSRIPSLDSLFFGRRTTLGEEGAILIGPVESPEESLKINEAIEQRVFKGRDARLIESWETALTFRIGSASNKIFTIGKPDAHFLPLEQGKNVTLATQIETTTLRSISFYSVGPNGLGLDEIGRLWDDVSLSPLEKDVISALRIISSAVDRVALKASRDGTKVNSQNGEAMSRIPFVKVEDFDEPIPLRALGDGVNRLFGLALALVSARDGLLLIDQIENGIHYSVQADLWRLVFETAARLNVQVFATTHSYDCIKAFEEAARESEEEGVLVRLTRKGDRTLVGEFDERELEIAVGGEIEVR
jgi:AAA domain, putative AbiEii toxin, Type IV TA system/AAA ATPase domain